VQFDGSFDTLERYVGQPLVVNFFASWCAPCLAELPEFERVHRRLEGEVTFVGLNLQDPADSGRAVVARTGITYDVARDPDGLVFTAFEAFAMPTTVFIDAAGQVVQVWSGQLNGEMLEERIEELLV
jgi:thiol-disulfide isomerase/thioredoxin